MFKNKLIVFILFTAVLVYSKAYGQEAINDQQIKTIVGKVMNIDEESGVISIETGSIAKQAFSDAHLDADLVWDELIKSGYIDLNGKIQTRFYALNEFSKMLLPKKLNAKKKLIYNIFQKTLADNGMMEFYISIDSTLLRGTHRIASLEIKAADPVTIQYITASLDRNNVIRLVDNNKNETDTD